MIEISASQTAGLRSGRGCLSCLGAAAYSADTSGDLQKYAGALKIHIRSADRKIRTSHTLSALDASVVLPTTRNTDRTDLEGTTMRRIGTALAAVAVALALGAAEVPSASATTTQTVRVVAHPAEAVSGSRIKVAVRVTDASRARVVRLQTQTKDIFGNPSWINVAAQRVNGTSRHTLRAVVDQTDRQRFRAVAKYSTGKVVESRAFGVTVWTWTPLSKFSAYYATNGINGYSYSSFAMAGNQYLGWYTSGSYGMWEMRYTPGRHCKRFRGNFGVMDKSVDGSSAQFTIASMDTGIVLYQSPTVTPGVIAKADFDLATPYRLSIQAKNTSPSGVLSYPAIGDPELLCTGLPS